MGAWKRLELRTLERHIVNKLRTTANTQITTLINKFVCLFAKQCLVGRLAMFVGGLTVDLGGAHEMPTSDSTVVHVE